MPFILLIIGAAMVTTAIRGTQGQLASQLGKDFTGQRSFLYALTAIFLIGAIGYIPQLKKTSDYLLGLILLSFIISNTGLWSVLRNAVAAPPKSLPETALPSPGGSSSGGSGGLTSTSTVGTAAKLIFL